MKNISISCRARRIAVTAVVLLVAALPLGAGPAQALPLQACTQQNPCPEDTLDQKFAHPQEQKPEFCFNLEMDCGPKPQVEPASDDIAICIPPTHGDNPCDDGSGDGSGGEELQPDEPEDQPDGAPGGQPDPGLEPAPGLETGSKPEKAIPVGDSAGSDPAAAEGLAIEGAVEEGDGNDEPAEAVDEVGVSEGRSLLVVLLAVAIAAAGGIGLGVILGKRRDSDA